MTPVELRAATRRAIERFIGRIIDNLDRPLDLTPQWQAVEAAIDAEIAAAHPQWQPIETAPKVDRRMILVWWPWWKGVPFCGWWSEAHGWWAGDYAVAPHSGDDPGPIHWMPLPAPPEDK